MTWCRFLCHYSTLPVLDPSTHCQGAMSLNIWNRTHSSMRRTVHSGPCLLYMLPGNVGSIRHPPSYPVCAAATAPPIYTQHDGTGVGDKSSRGEHTDRQTTS